jgi:transposase
MPVLRDIAVSTRHRPRSRPDVVVADRAYSLFLDPGRAAPLGNQRRHPSASRPDNATRTTRKPRRNPSKFDPAPYGRRNVVERAFARLKNWRTIAIRYDKHARTYRASLVLAAIVMLWL